MQAECRCGHACGYHLFGFGRCTACSCCWWFRLKKLPWMLVRYACGCSGYRDSKLELADDEIAGRQMRMAAYALEARRKRVLPERGS